MSFLPISEENQQAPGGQTTNAPSAAPPPQTGGSAGAASSAPAKGVTAGSPTQFGSSASKLGDYLSTNAPNITNQANTLAGTLNQQYGALNQGITDAANQFGQQVQGGYAASNPDTVNQAIANPSQFASDPNNVKAFQGQYNDTYTGPTSFEATTPYSNIQNQVSQAVQQGQLVQTPAGLQTYLQGLGGNPTQASSTLDTLLMQGNPQAQQTINQAAGQFGNLTGQLSTAAQGADQSVVDAQNAAQTAQAAAQSQFNPAIANWQDALNNTVAQNEAQRTAYNQNQNSLLSAVQSGGESLTPAQLTALGNPDYNQINAFNNDVALGNQNYGGVGNVNLANFLTGSVSPDNTVATAANSATPTDYANANAFSQLVGSNFNNPLPSTPESPWTLPTSTAGLNISGALEQEVGALQGEDKNLVGSFGNPTLAGNQLTGLSGSPTPLQVYQIQEALQRLNNPTMYTSTGAPVSPPTGDGPPLQPPVKPPPGVFY